MTFVGVRYDPKYNLTANDQNILARCVRTLLERMETICTDYLRRLKDYA